MKFTIEQLTSPISSEQAEAHIIGYLQALNMKTTDWTSGSVQLTLVKITSYLYANFTEMIASLATLGFNQLSTGNALDQFSQSNYNNFRTAAEVTQGYFKFEADGYATLPQSLSANALIVSDDDLVNPHIYSNIDGYNITATISYIKMQAESPGADYNLNFDSTLKINSPSLVGFTVTNPDDYFDGTKTNPPGIINLQQGWITQVGADEEDDVNLRAKNTAKWGAISPINNDGGLEYYVRSVSSKITKVLVTVSGVNTVDVYIASPTGVIPSSDQAFIKAQAIVNLKRMITTSVTVRQVVAQTVPIAATVIFKVGYNTAQNRTTITNNINEYINSFPIGGGGNPTVYHSQIISIIQNSSPGIISCSVLIDGVAGNKTISTNRLLTSTTTVTGSEI